MVLSVLVCISVSRCYPFLPIDASHLLSVMQLVVRSKGAELRELEEEAVDLVERHNTVEASVGVSERELVDKVGGGQCRSV